MRRIIQTPSHALALVAVVLLLMLSACESEDGEPTPTADVSPLYTAAAQTLTGPQATELPVVPFVLVTPTAVAVPNTGGAVPLPATGGGVASPAAAATCENATFLSDVTVPDGTVVAPGQSFVKTWALSNSGSCPWTPDDKLVLVNGDPMGGSQVPLTGTVAAGTTANLSVNLTAPVVPGNYTGTWRLKNAAGNYFGDVVTVMITVSGTPEP